MVRSVYPLGSRYVGLLMIVFGVLLCVYPIITGYRGVRSVGFLVGGAMWVSSGIMIMYLDTETKQLTNN